MNKATLITNLKNIATSQPEALSAYIEALETCSDKYIGIAMQHDTKRTARAISHAAIDEGAGEKCFEIFRKNDTFDLSCKISQIWNA